MAPVNHFEFDAIRSALAPADWTARPEKRGPAPSAEASVAVVLRATDPLQMLLVRRSISESDPWSGHMALPGGRREPVDGSSLDTAIRETREECGLELDPAAGLGQLAPVSPQSLKLPTLRVSPFVFGVDPSAQAYVASRELDAIFWVSLDELLDPANHQSVQIPLISTVREFPAYTVAGQTVWGMTYRVVSRFLQHYQQLTP